MTALANAHQLFQQGQLEATIDALDAVAPADRDLDWHTLKAVTHALQGEFSQAEKILHGQLEQHPDNLALRINLGTVQLDQGHIEAALATLAFATQQHPGAAAAWHNLGIAQMRARQWDTAAESLFLAAKRAPEQLEIRLQAALALAHGGHSEAAQSALASLGENPALESPDLLLMGNVLMALRENAAAQKVFRQLLDAIPGHPEALINLATLAEQANQPMQATELLDALPPDLRDLPVVSLVQARLHDRKGQYQDALDSLPEHGIHDPDLAVEIMFLRARLLDRLGRYEEAFSAATTANTGARQLRPGPDKLFDTLLAQTLSADAVNDWEQRSVNADSHPIFVLGLPRSGSTLLDVMLDGHSQLQLLSESACLENLIPRLEELSGQPYPAALNALSAEQLQQLQLEYFDAVNRKLQGRTPGTRLVDKNPLHVLRLPLIQRLFPGARIILTTRSLRDAALSCFMNDLGGRGQQGFWSLPESEQILQRLLDLAAQQSEALGITPWTLAYEDLVNAPQQQIQQVCEFLGLEFDERMLQTAQTADQRGALGTPSYVDVTKPISSGQIDRWRHYAAHFDKAPESP